jgi:hypothetical protein
LHIISVSLRRKTKILYARDNQRENCIIGRTNDCFAGFTGTALGLEPAVVAETLYRPPHPGAIET